MKTEGMKSVALEHRFVPADSFKSGSGAEGELLGCATLMHYILLILVSTFYTTVQCVMHRPKYFL